MDMFGLGKSGDLITINLDGDISNELAMLRGIDYARRNKDKLAEKVAEYTRNDVRMTYKAYQMLARCIVKVIFNDPATIVLWGDGSKTVVKAMNEPFDPEKGFAMAIAKKHFGNTGRYYEVFKQWLPKED